MQETSPISIPSQDLPFAESTSEGRDSEAPSLLPGGVSGTNGAIPCSHRTRTGRPCQLPVMDTSSGLCFRHAGLRVPKKDPDDLSADLLDKLTEFHSAYDVNEFLARLLFLLVRNRISAKRAGVLTYVASQLLHSLGEVRLVEKAEKDEPVQIIVDTPRPERD